LNKKFIFIGAGGLVLLLIIVLVVTSCGGGGKKSVVGDKTLTIWGLEDPALYTNAISDFQTTNPSYKVTYVQKNASDYETAALNEIAAGKGPDVWAIPNNWIPKYQDKLVAMPSTLLENKKTKQSSLEVYKATFPNIVSQDNVINNNVYGMPLAIDSMVLFCNPNILSQTLNNYLNNGGEDTNGTLSQIFTQGPRTWDDFATMTKMITQKSGTNISQSAVALGTSTNVNNATDILTLLMMQDGVKMTSDDLSTAQFHTKQNVFGGQDFPGAQALNFYAAFANPSTDLYTWNNSMEDSVHAFAEGKTAMMIGYTADGTNIKRISPDLGFTMLQMPQIKETKNPVNLTTYTTYTVTRASQNSATAWQFINNFTNSNDANAYFNSFYNKTNLQPARLTNISTDSNEGKRILSAQDWYNPDPDKVNPIFANTIQQVNDGKNPQTAIEYAGSQVTSLLGKLKQ